MFQNAFNFGSGGGTSISNLQDKVAKHPADASAWRDLATAYETKQRTKDAVGALEQYTALRPKDTNALSELASQYGTLAQSYATDYQNAQANITAASPSAALAPSANTVFGKIFNDPKGLQDPIGSVAAAQAQTAFSNYQGAQRSAETTLQKLAKLTPKDVTVQYQLGQAAQAAGDYKGAVKAYKAFLKLSPNDVEAPQVKQLLKQAQARAGGL